MTTESQQETTSPVLGDETVTPEVAETHTEAPETTDEVEQETAESSDDSETKTEEPEQADRDKEFRRLKRRNEKLLQDRAVERAERERLAAELARRDASKDDDEAPGQRAEDDPREIARQMRIAEKTAESVTRMAQDARQKFKDFEPVIQDLLEETGPLIDQRTGHPSPLMEAVLDTDKASEILYHLGKNPELAAELVGLSASRLGRRIERIESELRAKAAPPKTSGAAKPLAAVKPSPPPVVDQSKLTDAQWRALQLQKRMSA